MKACDACVEITVNALVEMGILTRHIGERGEFEFTRNLRMRDGEEQVI